MIFIYSFAEYAGPVFDLKKIVPKFIAQKNHAEPKSEKKFHAPNITKTNPAAF